MSISIIKPGLLTTVQDVGRYGYQKYGIIVSGAMDVFSLKCANILVGNDEQEAALEMTFVGATIRFDCDAVIAICGGDFSPSIDDQLLPMWKGVFVQKGSTLTFGNIKSGARCYLAIAGGFDIPKKFNSCSTYLQAKLGGLEGRALKAGDRLYVRKGKRNVTDHMLARLHEQDRPFLELTPTMSTFVRPNYAENPIIRVLKGLQYNLFDDASIEAFFSEPFAIEPQSDRMGYRLSGRKIGLQQATELLSEAVAFGTIQVPPDGNPIILMADRQTCGGYPKIAQVISVDLPVLAQLKIGANVRFQKVTLKEAQMLLLKRERIIRQIQTHMKWYYKMHWGWQ